MTFRSRSLPLAVLLVAAVPPAPAPARAAGPAAERIADASQLLARFARIEGLSARFREEKRMALLAEPLVSEGELYYARPDKMLRKQTAPEPATVLLDGDRLQMASAAGRQQLDLSTQPVVRMFVDSVRWVLAGDEARLRDLYDVTFEARPGGAWHLHLAPRKDPLRKLVHHMTLDGHGVVLDEIRIVEHGGDETRTTFSHVDPHRRFTPAEIARIFRLP